LRERAGIRVVDACSHCDVRKLASLGAAVTG
jgi:hypothetical protein